MDISPPIFEIQARKFRYQARFLLDKQHSTTLCNARKMTPFTPRRMTKSFFSHLFAFVIGVSFTSLLMGTNLPAHLVNFNEASVANKTKKLVAAAAAQSWPYQKYFKSKYFSGGCNITGGYRVAFLTLNIGPVASPYANVSRGLQVEYARQHCYDVHVLTRPINGTREPA